MHRVITSLSIGNSRINGVKRRWGRVQQFIYNRLLDVNIIMNEESHKKGDGVYLNWTTMLIALLFSAVMGFIFYQINSETARTSYESGKKDALIERLEKKLEVKENVEKAVTLSNQQQQKEK